MTGGTVVVLGTVGQNFAAGMTGGVIYVAGQPRNAGRAHQPAAARRSRRRRAAEQKLLRELLETHERLTGSRVARSLLRFDRHLAGFCRIVAGRGGGRPRRWSRPRPSRSPQAV